MKKYILLALASILLFSILFSCQKREKIIDQETGERIKLSINRFEDIIFEDNSPNYREFLEDNYEEYKYLFNNEIDDQYFEMIREFAMDSIMKETYKAVADRYPNLAWLEKDLEQGFARLQSNYKDIIIPKIYTLILGPDEFSAAYHRRIAATEDFIAIAIDLYSIPSFETNSVYSHFPQYLQNILDSNFIAPDLFYTYLREVTTIDIPLIEHEYSSSLIEIMIERGKYLYSTKELLPSYKLKDVLRYSKEEMEWVEKNERNIWAFLTQNNLLFEKNRSKYINMIGEGPTTKGIIDSPPRLGEYIGYRIVEEYAKKNKPSIKDILELRDMNAVLKESGYKPKR